jgi:ligand-binding sensor domain-containing protein/signal transduction histidine kinase
MIPAIIRAQSTDVAFEGLQVQGKGVDHANIIFEDGDGFIWFGRVNGLFKYDGSILTRYQHDSNDSTSLSNSYVTAIGEDKVGFLWVGTQDGLNKFNPATGKCQRVKHNPSIQTSLSHNHITAICFDRSGTMWVGTSGGGLNVTERGATDKAAPRDLHLKHYRHDPDNPNSLSDDNIFCIVEDTRSNGEIVWIGTARGLSAFHQSAQRFSRHFHDPNNPKSLSHDQVWSLHEDRTGSLWIGTGGGGVSRLNQDNDSEFWFTHYDLGKSVQVSTIAKDRSDNLWIGTYHHCLFRLNLHTDKPIHFKHDVNAINSFRHETIYSVIMDRAGTLWVSCQSGIYKHDPQKEKLRQYTLGSSTPYTPGYRDITAICEDRENNIWVGTWAEGLAKFDLYTEQFKFYAPSVKNRNTLRSPWITTIHEDRGGLLWIGTTDGLECFDPKSEVFRHYGHNPTDPNDPSRLSSDYISAIYEDSQGALWVGTTRGLDKLNRRTQTFRHYLTDAKNHISRIGYYVSAINEDDSGNLLIGGKGLFRLNRNSGDLTRYPHIAADSSRWDNDVIGCIHRDAIGGLWLATDGNGLFKLRKDETLLHLTEADGLPSNLVWGILEDAQGVLWISTFKGMISLDPSSNAMKRHAVADDWRSNEFRPGVFHKSNSGRFYFGNLRGFVSVLPQLMRDNSYVPPVHITSFSVFNQPVIPNRPFSKLDQIQLTHKQNMFSFDFVALNYTLSEKNQYAYKMEGFHDDWIQSGNEHTALFMNLDPGEYVFKVKASNNDGVWNEEGASVRVVIDPPFWLSWWFRAIVILLLGLVLYGFYRYRLSQVLALERLRLRIADDLHDDIGSELSSIALESDLIARRLSREKPEQDRLLAVGRMIRHAAGNLRDVVWIVNPEQDKLEDLVARMREVAATMLTGIHYAFRVEGPLATVPLEMELKRHVLMMFKEVMNNIVRHAHATRVEIEVELSTKQLRICVNDNGVGFDVATQHGGRGLKSLQSRASVIGGTVEVQSAPGSGTTVCLKTEIIRL